MSEDPGSPVVEPKNADEKLRLLVEACQALSRDAPADTVPLFHDYGPARDDMYEFDIREALADEAYSAGEQSVATRIRRTLRAIGIEPASGDDRPLPPATEKILAQLGVVEDVVPPASSAHAQPPVRRNRRAAAPNAKGLVARAVLAAKLGVSRERIRQLINEGKITEGPDGIDLAKAIGEYELNLDKSRVLADRSREDWRKRKARRRPAPVA